MINNGYLFKGIKLYIPQISIREPFVWNLHIGGLVYQFGRDKSFLVLHLSMSPGQPSRTTI